MQVRRITLQIGFTAAPGQYDAGLLPLAQNVICQVQTNTAYATYNQITRIGFYKALQRRTIRTLTERFKHLNITDILEVAHIRRVTVLFLGQAILA